MKLYGKAAEAEKNGTPFAVVTIISAEGTVSRREGRMLVFQDGSSCGTIGGGVVEAEAIHVASECIVAGHGRRAVIDNGGKGRIEVFIDVPAADRSVIIVGNGHVGTALGELLSALGWRTVLLERGTDRKRLLAERINSRTAVVIIGTESASLVPAALSTSAFYVGLVASRRMKMEESPRLFFPAGLDLGGESAEEVALSVAAEILSVFNKREAENCRDWRERVVLVRGAGDLATGVIIRLHNAGFKVVALETEKPTTIRRTVAFSEAVYDGEAAVEGVRAVLASSSADILRLLDSGSVPVVVDPSLAILDEFSPSVLVDAVIAKRNLGTRKGMAPLVIALGPGFTAGEDCDAVIETKRGHTLGSIIRSGSAAANTGIPGNIAGYAEERVIHSPAAGVFRGVRKIGEIVKKGDKIAEISSPDSIIPVTASIDGMLRGLLHDGITVAEGFKIADIDPRGSKADFRSVSDKARAVAGGVLEAVDAFMRGRW